MKLLKIKCLPGLAKMFVAVALALCCCSVRGQAPDWPADLLAAAEKARTEPAKSAVLWDELEKKHPVACDWMQQDYQPNAHQWLANPQLPVLRSMAEKTLRELQETGALEWKNATQEADATAERLLRRYVQMCEARRTLRLRSLAEHAPQFVFTKHWNIGGSHYAYTEGQSDAQAERHFYPGSALCIYSFNGGAAKVETLLEDKNGVIRDPDVSYDGKRILFAWKKSDRQDDYHLYEMDLASRAVRQLTFGLGVADYEGVYLPDGDILFNSTRCVQIVDCWWTEVSNLYRCGANGQGIRRITFDQVHDNYPTVTADGRILYTRWEYNDRSQIYPQPLMQMQQDGTGQTEFYGANSWFPTTILHARNIPGTPKVLAIATGHHSRQTGKLILLDPTMGRQENEGAQLVAPVRITRAERIDSYGQVGDLFQYPYPLSENECLVTYHPVGWQRDRDQNWVPRFGNYFMTMDGRRELLVSDPKLPCNQPVPLRVRPVPHARPRLVDYQRDDGTVYVQDVYTGPTMTAVKRGTVKTLRVVALDFRAAGVGNNSNGGPGGGALISTPVAIGNGAWDPKSIIGDATVREDGSVFFKAPARKAFYFQLLDDKGRMVQTMRSWTSLQPGENASCVGCHESKNSTAVTLSRPTLALQAGPEILAPFFGPERGFSFSREIQPILDAKCISCHNGKQQKISDLSSQPVEDAGAKRNWSQAYLALTHSRPDDRGRENGRWRGNPDHAMVKWISAASVPTPLPAYTAGANRSQLMELLDKGHEKVEMTPEELRKISAWIDLGVPFCGDYVEANTWNDAEKAKYQRYLEKRQRLEQEERDVLKTVMK